MIWLWSFLFVVCLVAWVLTKLEQLGEERSEMLRRFRERKREDWTRE